MGLPVASISATLGVSRATIINDQVALRIASRFSKQGWLAGERIKLDDDGWGGMRAGTYGTVVKVFDRSPSQMEIAVQWDNGPRDLVDPCQVAECSPLEQLSSIG